MKSRSRDIRSTRKEVQAMKRDTALFDPGGCECLTCGCIFIGDPHHDTCGVCIAEEAEAATFPLKDGTQADPRQAWVLPSNEQPTKE